MICDVEAPEPGKTTIILWEIPGRVPHRPGYFLRKIRVFSGSRAEENHQKTALLRRERILRAKMKKSQKVTEIYFTEASPIIEVFTYNTDLKRRLIRYAEKHPDLCSRTDDDGFGGLRFEIQKGRLSFRLTEPYSAERRAAASKYAKGHLSADRLKNVNAHAGEG